MASGHPNSHHFLIVLICITFATFTCQDQSPPRLLSKDSLGDNRKVTRAGSAVNLQCPVEGNQVDDMYFEWFKDGKPVEMYDNRIRMTKRGRLKIKPATTEDTGKYYCKAINGFGSVEYGLTLVVLGEAFEDPTSDDFNKNIPDPETPLISTESSSFVRHGELGSKPLLLKTPKSPYEIIKKVSKSSIKFNCNVSGEPKPTIAWYHNNEQLSETESKRGRYSLVINDLKIEDSGNYTCLAQNIYGSVSTSFILEVIDQAKSKPQIEATHPFNTSVTTGGTATLQCRVKSEEVPHIQWLKKVDLNRDHYKETDDGVYHSEHFIQIQDEYFLVLRSETIENVDGVFYNDLIIPNVRENDAGNYICYATNSMGYSLRSAFITVLPSKQPINWYQSKHGILPSPVIVAFIFISVIVIISIGGWIGFCCCQKGDTRTQTTQSNASQSLKQNSSCVASQQNLGYTQVVNCSISKYHNLPSKKSRTSSPLYSELISSDNKHNSTASRPYSSAHHTRTHHLSPHYFC